MKHILMIAFLFCCHVVFSQTRVIVFEHLKNRKGGEYFGDIILTDLMLDQNRFVSFFRDTTYSSVNHRVFSFDSSQFSSLATNLLRTTMEIDFLSTEIIGQSKATSSELIQVRFYSASGILQSGFSGYNLRKSKKWIKQLIVALKADSLTSTIDVSELNDLLCTLKRSCKIKFDSGEDDFKEVKFRKSDKARK